MKITDKMAYPFVYRIFEISGDETEIRNHLSDYLIHNGYRKERGTGDEDHFRYPKLTFSSKKPLTCISRLSLDIVELEDRKAVRFGVTFTKIRAFTIGVLFVICVIVPAVSGMIRSGEPRFSPVAFLGIPLGFIVHYHVRWRVFRTLQRLVTRLEAYSGIHR